MDNHPSRPGASDAGNTTLAQNILFLKVLKDLAAGCADRGVPLLAIKGSALLGLEYGNLSERRMTDLDVLVRRSDFGAVERILMALGAARAPGDNVLHQESYERIYYHTAGQTRLAIDLHHAFAHPRAFPIDYERVLAEAQPHPLEDLRGAGVRRPSAEHALLILALHQLYDAFPADWRNFHDAQRILEFNPVDTRRLAREAQQWGVRSLLRFFLERGRALDIIQNAVPLLKELPLSWVRRKAIELVLDPASTDPFRIPLTSKRARQILLFYLFRHQWEPAIGFPLYILSLKARGLVGRMIGSPNRKSPTAGQYPRV
jgi:hypothetical protein